MELRNSFIAEVKKVIEDSRVKAVRSVDHIRVRMYWELGRKIVEEEQSGSKRANYGRYLILSLSQQLTTLYGQAFNKRQLERYRQFYRFFPIASALRTQFSWTHYKTLLSVENQLKREFYEAVVKITLPENNQTIIATRYQLYLPTEEQLLEELKKIK